MNYSTKEIIKQFLVVRLHLLVVISCVGLALVGQVPESSGGWLACPAVAVNLRPARGGGKRAKGARPRPSGGCCGHWSGWGSGWRVAAGRSLLIGLLWLASGQPGSVWLIGLPWLIWGWAGSRWGWPRLGRQPEWRLMGWLLWQGQRVVVVIGLGESLMAFLHHELWLSLVEEGLGDVVGVSLGGVG